MSEISITLPTATSSKAEELAILQKLTDAFHTTESYLNGLFSDRLVQWFEWQIENNINTNIMEEYLTALNDNEKVRHAWGEEAKDLKDQLKKLDKEDQKFLADQIEETEKVLAQIENWKHLAEVQQSRADEIQHVNKNMYEEMREMDQKIKDQAQTILELKARLFDLLDK